MSFPPQPVEQIPVICLAGPTGCGKTGLAVKMARQIGAEIMNADSRQVYRDFPIITAQPSKEEQEGIPHHLFGFLESSEKISSGQWSMTAREKAAEILARGNIPLLVGGTGFYFQTLLHGIAHIPPVPQAVSLELARRLQNEGPNILFAELETIDPSYAARIHPNDSQRVARALEVFKATGKTFSWWHENSMEAAPCHGPLIVIDANLSSLEPALLHRIDLMLAAGAMEEARKALEKCSSKNAPAWNGIGCAELRSFLENETSLEECKNQWFRNTRAYARRQLTWFHGRKEALYISPGNLEKALLIVENFLENPVSGFHDNDGSQEKRRLCISDP